MRPEIGWRSRSTLGDAASDFADRAKQLSDLARQAYAAQQAGNVTVTADLMQQYRALNNQLAPQQQAAVKAALADEMPSSFLVQLTAWGDYFTTIFKNPAVTIAIVVGGYWLLTQGLRGGASARHDW